MVPMMLFLSKLLNGFNVEHSRQTRKTFLKRPFNALGYSRPAVEKEAPRDLHQWGLEDRAFGSTKGDNYNMKRCCATAGHSPKECERNRKPLDYSSATGLSMPQTDTVGSAASTLCYLYQL